VRYLSLAEVLELHRRVVAGSGGATPVRDLGGLESAIAQPRATFGNEDLYPDVPSKAAALAFSLINNHPFVDGNKRVGHAALETFLILNGSEIEATVDDSEAMILAVAAGKARRDDLLEWIRKRMVTLK
jgi:death-on-curing protein